MSNTVSIITACYNAAEYIGRCIDSVRAQSFADWELIVVDDGSSDSSLTVSRQYADADNRIRVLCKKNGGVSSARNAGLDEARGQWVTFLDADDALPADALEHLIDCVGKSSTQPDIVFAGYKVIRNDKTSECPPEKFASKAADVLAMELFKPSDYPYQGYICSKLFRKSIIDKYNLRFDESIIYNEDRLFTFTYLSQCQKGVYSTHPVYCYYQNGTGAMASINGPGYWKFETDLDAFVKMYERIHRFNSKRLTRLLHRATYISYRKNVSLNNKYGDANRERTERLRCKLRSVVPQRTVMSFKLDDWKNSQKAMIYDQCLQLKRALTNLNRGGGKM